MHEETTIEAVRWRMVRELEKSRDAAQDTLRQARDSHERADELAERAEEAIRDENRREVREWARGVLADPKTVVMALATTGLDDPVDVVEVVALDREGETIFSERVRPAAFEGCGHTAASLADALTFAELYPRMHGHTAASLADAPTFEDLYPRLGEVLKGKWVVFYGAEYFEGVLAQTLDRYDLEMLEIGVECAMAQYARIQGEWSITAETYSSVALPGRDRTPLGNAHALLDLLRELAGERVTESSGAGGRGGRRHVEDHDINSEDFEDIPFKSVFPAAVRYPLVF